MPLILLFGFAICVKAKRAHKSFILGCPKERATATFSLPCFPQKNLSALCKLPSCSLSQNYQDFNILESSTTAKVNWNGLKCWKAWGGSGGLFVVFVKRWRRWRTPAYNQLSVVLRKQGSHLEIVLAVLSLSDPDKRKSSLNTAKTECSSHSIVVVFQRCCTVFGSQKCTEAPKAPLQLVWRLQSDTSSYNAWVTEQSARRWHADTFPIWSIWYHYCCFQCKLSLCT